jgi:hypothetical protein
MAYKSKVLSLFLTKGTTDKQYDIHVEAAAGGGYHVFGMNGRRGSATTRQQKTKHGPVSLAAAESIYDAVVHEKERKGYTSLPHGGPYAGVFGSHAVISGSAATCASVAQSPSWTHWVGNASPEQVTALLDLEGFGVQRKPFGPRVVLDVSGVSVKSVGVADGEPYRLPDDVEAELKTVFQGFHLEGCFDGSQLFIVDGYDTKARTPAAAKTASFELRMGHFVATVKRASTRHVKAFPVFTDSDKYQAISQLTHAGELEVLLRPLSGPYDTRVPTRIEQAGAIAHLLM